MSITCHRLHYTYSYLSTFSNFLDLIHVAITSCRNAKRVGNLCASFGYPCLLDCRPITSGHAAEVFWQLFIPLQSLGLVNKTELEEDKIAQICPVVGELNAWWNSTRVQPK